jgi:F-type H+-transporting ATPase subunit b
MIDINTSLFLQLANFIILLIVLNIILFKPIMQIMQDREQGISSAFSDAKVAQERMQNLLDQYNGSLADAKQKATAAYSALYQQGLDVQREMIAAQRSTSGELLEKARGEIAQASAAARGELKNEAERLSQEISAKLLGRAV